MRQKIILVTGASDRFGRLCANALAHSHHIVYASMHDTRGSNAHRVADVKAYARRERVDLRALELDGCNESSVNAAVTLILQQHGRIDVVVHSAERTAFGPAEAFTAEQFASLYDKHVLSAQRVNRAVLPHMRKSRDGLLVWLSSSSVAGGTPAYFSPYHAAKAGLDALAVQYAREVARWGIESTIVAPGAFDPCDDCSHKPDYPADAARNAEYETGPYAGFGEQTIEAMRGLVPNDADPGQVAGAVLQVVDTPRGERPFRVLVDPVSDGGEVGFAVIDRVREEMLRRLGFADVLKARICQKASNGSNGAT